MLVLRRCIGFLLTAATLVAGCGSPPPKPNKPPSLRDRIEAALDRAGVYLVKQQSPDGAWRSTVYGSMKDGPSLTPLVLESLYPLRYNYTIPIEQTKQQPAERIQTARQKGIDYLVAMVKDDGTVDPGPSGWTYPVYTAALAVTVLSGEDEPNHQARDAWLAFLRGHQVTEALGWQPDDPFYGGWGYADEPPKKPPAGQQLNPKAEPNISATVFALEALWIAGVDKNDPAVKKALTFVHRCQNFNEKGDPRVDDGGFFFLQADADRNKAGIVDLSEGTKTPRFRSYGSTTADGIRCLLACRVPRDHPRVQAAVAWLTDRFSARQHVGDFPEAQELARDSLYFYYCASLTRALLSSSETKLLGPQGWPQAMAAELLRRQRSDGSWRNEAGATREDDPLVATAFAVKALSLCKTGIPSEGGTP